MSHYLTRQPRMLAEVRRDLLARIAEERRIEPRACELIPRFDTLAVLNAELRHRNHD
jgi:hypothetical protein